MVHDEKRQIGVFKIDYAGGGGRGSDEVRGLMKGSSHSSSSGKDIGFVEPAAHAI
jgi:hypothetical protein